MERAVLLKTGNTIEPSDLALTSLNSNSASGVKAGDGILEIDLSKGTVLHELKRSIIENVLGRTGWNRTKAAQLLGLSRETLRYRIEKYNLKVPAAMTDP
jgi:DNA-binding NtrC family response regulator